MVSFVLPVCCIEKVLSLKEPRVFIYYSFFFPRVRCVALTRFHSFNCPLYSPPALILLHPRERMSYLRRRFTTLRVTTSAAREGYSKGYLSASPPSIKFTPEPLR